MSSEHTGSKANHISTHVTQVFNGITNDPKVKQALKFIEVDNERTLRDQIEITEIPAPSFQEQSRGQEYKRRLEALRLDGVHFDEQGNVFGVRKGSGSGPTVFVCAHLDTVFPEGTEVTVHERQGVYYAPGISDDGRGLAVVLSVLRALNEAGIETEGDILFGATVGEEGMGDLRGVKAFFKENPQVDGFISVEPGEPARTTYLATGSHRYKISYSGPGGHSFGAFGMPSAIHALGRAIAMISNLEVPEDPKTTFNVGEIRGGTSVNTIAAEASMLVDLRSNSQEELLILEEKFLDIVKQAANQENARWNRNAIQVHIDLVGDRPAGTQESDAAIVQAALAATKVLGFEPVLDDASSTDSNVPISLGIPAVTLGGGGDFGGCHTKEEYFNPTDAFYGVQKIMLTLLGLVGVHGTSQPLLNRKP